MKRLIVAGWLALFPVLLLAQAPGAAQDNAAQQQFQQLQHSLQQMQQQMEKLQAAQDPEERQQLMREHMQSLRQGMMMMASMIGSMPHAELGPHMQQCTQGDAACQLRNVQAHQALMQRYLVMMQGMMGQMMEQMGAQMSGGMHRGGTSGNSR
jgi:Mg2+ and Co2+ transporter CorA